MTIKNRKNYQVYRPGVTLTQIHDDDRILILRMKDLRDLDYPISRNNSYEKTVDEFFLQLMSNVSMRELRLQKDQVILLNEEGALVREHGKWSLLFTPDEGEHDSLPEDADLVQVYEALLKKEQEEKVCRVSVPERSLKTLADHTVPFSILDEYCKNHQGGYLSAAEMIVYIGPEEIYRHVPVCRYNKMSTVDRQEIENYHSINAMLIDYSKRYEQNKEQMQPLSIAVFGPPGSGKSFGVKQIAASCGAYRTTSLNLSLYDQPSDLFEAMVGAIKDCSAEEIPLIFIDEFDSELNGVSRGWLKYFLAPMQDGEYTVHGETYSIERAVFVFAGGTASTFTNFLPHNKEQEDTFRKIKGPDFVSRLKGVLNIKGINPSSETDRSHIIRRAMFLRQQLEYNIPGIFTHGDAMANISRALVSSLLRVSEYRHGARSLEFILGMCRLAGVDRFTPSCLPTDEQLDIHLDVKDFRQKMAFEQVMGSIVETYAKNAHESYRQKHYEEAEKMGKSQEELESIWLEPEMADWSELDEFYKSGYCSKIRYLGEHLEDYNTEVGIRPILPDAADSIHELYGPLLEQIAEMEHNRWIADKKQEGWRYGDHDDELKLSEELIAYDQLSEKTKEMIRRDVREVPNLLSQIGYELYRKMI